MKFKELIIASFLISVPTWAKITLPVDDSAEKFEIPRAEIKTYIQKRTLEDNLKPIRQSKPSAFDDEELLSIPSKYLPPDLRKKQNELRRLKAQREREKPKKLGQVKRSEFVTIRSQRSNQARKVKLEETVWAADTSGRTKAVLIPQRRLPKIEKLEEVSFEAGKEVRVEINPGDRRELALIFRGDVSKDPVKESLLEAYHAYEVEDYASATTLAFEQLGSEQSSREGKELARYVLAHSLYQAGFFASALRQLVPLVTSKWRRSAIGMSAKAIERTRDDAAANQILSKVSLSQIPEAFRGTFAFHLGRVLLQSGAASAALTAFQKVDEENSRFAEAQYFSGVIASSELGARTQKSEWSREGSRAYQARAFFEEAIRRARTSGAQDLLDLSNMAIARLAFQLQQFNQSVSHYRSIPNSSSFKKEANFETAWALYRLGEFNRSLGRLHPLGSPYFEARDLAEVWVLRSLNYLKLCRFDEANLAANTFKRVSAEVIPELRAAQKELSNAKFTEVSSFERSEVAPWIKRALNEDGVVRKDKTRESLLNQEIERLDVLRNNSHISNAELRANAADSLKALLESKTGAIAKAVKPYVRKRVSEILADYQGQATKMDFLKFEIYSQATKFPDALKRPQAKRLIEEAEFLPGVFLKGHEILWKFNSEYWIDEVAGYDYFIPTECSIEKTF